MFCLLVVLGSPAGGEPELKAAIIDQLYILEPNPAFIAEAKACLEASGFEVDIYQGKQVSVNFYRQLPKHRYKLIIFRAHSGLMQRQEDSQVMVKEETYLFTGEAYSRQNFHSFFRLNKRGTNPGGG